jgi:hypothetical protein
MAVERGLELAVAVLLATTVGVLAGGRPGREGDMGGSDFGVSSRRRPPGVAPRAAPGVSAATNTNPSNEARRNTGRPVAPKAGHAKARGLIPRVGDKRGLSQPR